MIYTPEQIENWISSEENEHLEFKRAENKFDIKTLMKYCAALANEGGGRIILGVTDKRPREVVGSKAFPNLNRIKVQLFDKLHIRIDVETVAHPKGRVVVFQVPSRPIGMPVQYNGSYLMRSGEDLTSMTPDKLKSIFEEAGPDFSAEICRGATFSDLDPDAIELFRSKWLEKSGIESLSTLSSEQVLTDAELISADGISYAALILVGTAQALGKFLPHSEVIFEYRSTEAAGPANQRNVFRQGFLLFYEKLWDTINLRNDIQSFQNGLFMRDIPTFSEGSIREAILNAVSHRDYRHSGSIFIRQYQQRIEITSPGGFPPGISPENILDKQLPRNRRIAEAFAKCGFVERSGQGANRMFEESIKESKPLPDFSGTDEYQVSLTLNGRIQDVNFLRFLEKVGKNRLQSFSTRELLVLELIRGGQPIPQHLSSNLQSLAEERLVERIGRGRGVRYILSRRFYALAGKKGTYTRKRGLDRQTNKELLIKHIKENAATGSRLNELLQVLPDLTRSQVQKLLKELKSNGRIHNLGKTRAARWYPN